MSAPSYDEISAAIRHAQDTIYTLASSDQPDHNEKAWLQQAWRRLDSALWCVRQITDEAGPDTRSIPGARFDGPFYGAHPIEQG